VSERGVENSTRCWALGIPTLRSFTMSTPCWVHIVSPISQATAFQWRTLSTTIVTHVFRPTTGATGSAANSAGQVPEGTGSFTHAIGVVVPRAPSLPAGAYGARSWGRLRLVINIIRWLQREVMSQSPLKGIESVVINNPVAPPASTSTGVRDFLFAGRLTDEKGIRLLLEAWGMAQTDWTLHIAGEGPLAGEVIEAARTLPRIEYHGAVSPDKVAQLRARTAVACVPALWDEPFGSVIAEACASGQAVLATRHGAPPEIVHEGLGELLDDDPTSWAKALSTRSSEKNGPWAAIAHWDSNFSPGHIAEAYETTLQKLL
jgi:glycosyltransferase involved in cell wall biosynthesis